MRDYDDEMAIACYVTAGKLLSKLLKQVSGVRDYDDEMAIACYVIAGKLLSKLLKQTYYNVIIIVT